MRALVLMLAVLAASCSRNNVAPPPSENDCTAETPLVAGIPGSPGHLVGSELNPNGMSELALLMRHMVADMEVTRRALGTAAPSEAMWPTHRKIRCSWPTRDSMRSPEFDGFARNYLTQLRALDAAPAAQRPAAYTSVLTACRACHEATCEGPLVVIEGLALPGAAH